MKNIEKKYIAIDLKSFYASVECVQRKLDPLRTNLVVADITRTEKTICLAVSPSLKAYGIPGRARLFEVIQAVERVNIERLKYSPNKNFEGSSVFSDELAEDRSLKADYIVAPPHMSLYMDISSKIYDIYLRYISPDDIHVYSIDEVFIDATDYLSTYGLTAHDLAMKLVREVLFETGITATAGIGTNLYLSKIAMDIVAKKMPADKDGVRIAELDEYEYRRNLWEHTPITDFWRVGKGYAKKLASIGLYTMGDIAQCSVSESGCNEETLYKIFGVNAELLIDHAWGWEPCTILDIKGYKPKNSSLSVGQVLKYPYSYEKGKLIVREMTEQLMLELTRKSVCTDSITLTVGYDKAMNGGYSGAVETDFYGRTIPKSAHGSVNLSFSTASYEITMRKVDKLYEQIVDNRLLIRRAYVVANNVIKKNDSAENTKKASEQYRLSDMEPLEENVLNTDERENRIQKAIISIKEKFGKNFIVKGMDLIDGATTIERNGQVGGHKA